LDAVLDRMIEDARNRNVSPDLVVIPDLTRFNSLNLRLYSRFRNLWLRVERPQITAEGTWALDGVNYAVITGDKQGMPWTTENSLALNQVILNDPRTFRLIGTYPLPNGDTARLLSIYR
jgi:hypothetical protein